MNALDQYTTLYEQHRATLESHSPAELNRLRPKALTTLRSIARLPERGDEGFPQVSLNEMFAPDYGINISRVDLSAGTKAPGGCGLPVPTAAIVVNDAFSEGVAPLPEGVEVCSIIEACRRYPHLIERQIAPTDNPVVALNTLLVQDGVFIRVASGVNATRPIQIVSTFNTIQPTLALRRIVIYIERGASATVMLCDHSMQGASPQNLACRVVEASIGQGAALRLYDLQEDTPQSRRASVFAAEQAADSRLDALTIFLGGHMTRNEFYPRHTGPGCHTSIGGLVVAAEEQTVDNSVRLVHTHPHCSSRQLFKYALFDNARASFEGMVKVERDATATDARQSNRNLIASPSARMYAMPQLEIYCDDVKASHGSATGQLDERALFYMRQRGIPLDEARMMLVNAFMTDVLDTIDELSLRERMRHLVDLRLRGAEAVCNGCMPS